MMYGATTHKRRRVALLERCRANMFAIFSADLSKKQRIQSKKQSEDEHTHYTHRRGITALLLYVPAAAFRRQLQHQSLDGSSSVGGEQRYARNGGRSPVGRFTTRPTRCGRHDRNSTTRTWLARSCLYCQRGGRA